MISKQYELAREIFAEYGVDTDKAIEVLDGVPLSIHCWQLDYFAGFENPSGELSGGIAVTGSAEGAPKSKAEYFEQMRKTLSLIPGKKKIATHAVYLDTDKNIERNEILPEHFSSWVDFAKSEKVGLDFNPTYFSHEKSADGFTLSHSDEGIRRFWIEHGKQSRKVGEYFGRETGEVCITNHWIPDGYKDTTVDTMAPRMRLIESLNEIFSEKIDRKYNIDSVESKLFGLGVESYTVGSHEFYTNYCALTNNAIVCLDVGHFHPTESVAAKLSSYLCFNRELMLHVSRGVRWDSDHIVTLDSETMAIMEEIVRCNALDRVHIGTDYFDGSVNGIYATAIGSRAAKEALLRALLLPNKLLEKAEAEGDLTRRLALLEAVKMLPFGLVWNYYCKKHSCPTDLEFSKIK